MIGVEWAWRGIAILLAFGVADRFSSLTNQTTSLVVDYGLIMCCAATCFALGVTSGYFEDRVVAWVKR